jgi:hypothetical protein
MMAYNCLGATKGEGENGSSKKQANKQGVLIPLSFYYKQFLFPSDL